jgi:hypothetical protein
VKQFAPTTWKETVDHAFAFRRCRDGKIKEELCRRIALVKATVGCSEFPTNVEAIASHVGISDIRRVPLANRGRLMRGRGGYEVEVNQSLDSGDQRFVLAHEITHLLLGELLSDETGERRSYNRIEALCDYGAREILLPMNSVRYELRQHHTISLTDFAAIAQEANCSVITVAETASELPGTCQDLVFLFCRNHNAMFEVEKVVPSLSYRIEIQNDKTSVIGLAYAENRLTSGLQKIWIDAHETEIQVEAMPINGFVVVLAQLSGLRRR